VGGDWLIYSKINCENVLYEGNLFGPSAGGGCGNAAVGIGTSEPGMPDASQAVVRNAVVRDNIFTGIRGDAALAVMNSSEVWIYNNTFWGNGGDGLRAVLMMRGNTAPVEGVHLYNNLLENNHPAARGDGRLVWIREGVTAPIAHDYNLLWDNVVSSDLTLAGEPHGVAASAQLVSPRVPPLTVFDADRVMEIAQGFAPAAGSPAAGAGVAVIEMSGHPNWDPAMLQRVADVLGQDRNGAWDLGAVGAR
jgi:hypothetical protein